MDNYNLALQDDHDKSDSYKCSYNGCGKQFKRKDRLEIHVRSHTGERPFVCTYQGCGKSYARSQHLSRHIMRTHDSDYRESLQIECPQCHLQLANQNCLSNHQERFHNVSPLKKVFECTEESCNEKFHKKKQLILHKLTHSSQLVIANKVYRCTHEGCNKTFSFPNKLKRHMKIHEGYTCDVNGCNQVFPTWTALRKHKAVDHFQVPTCTICQATFQRKSNLTQHIKIHATSREPLVCPIENCGRIFFYKKNVQQHVQEYHEGINVWKNKRQRKLIGPHKKRKVSKKPLAVRLCGVDKVELTCVTSTDETSTMDCDTGCGTSTMDCDTGCETSTMDCDTGCELTNNNSVLDDLNNKFQDTNPTDLEVSQNPDTVLILDAHPVHHTTDFGRQIVSDDNDAIACQGDILVSQNDHDLDNTITVLQDATRVLFSA